MIQLILDGIEMPESRNGGYTASKTPLSVDVEMISGRLVRELRGTVWTISYQYGYFTPDTMHRIISACEKGRREAITCGFLIQESEEEALTYSEFLVVNFKRPQFMWSKDGKPLWADFSMELREVNPSD